MLQDLQGLLSLQNGLTVRRAQTIMVSVVKDYVQTVCENEKSTHVGAQISAALRSVLKACNGEAGRKIRPPLQNALLCWAKEQDDAGKLAAMLADGPWYMAEAAISSFLEDLRAALTALSDSTRHRRAAAWRTELHDCLQDMAKHSPAAEVMT